MDSMTSSSSSLSPHAHLNNVYRKVLRKGTHSCWECKRRKTKCVVNPLAGATACNACRRRGVPCVSQKFPEESVLAGLAGGGVKSLQSPHTRGEHPSQVQGVSPVPNDDRLDRNVLSLGSLRPSQLCQTPPSGNGASAPQGRHNRISHLLHESLPSPEDYERMRKADPQPTVLAHEILTMPYTSLVYNELEKPECFLAAPGLHEHPVLLARHMLLLAGFLQHLHPDMHEAIKGLSETPRAMSERLADLAINLVTTNDELLGSIEGLECVMIESVYHANLGDLQRSWTASRRAVSIAQLIGLNRLHHRPKYSVLDSRMKYYPQTMLFRIVFLDLFLSLMLGLPQACVDYSTRFDATSKDSFLERLEQKHCVAASCILERNKSDPGLDDYTVTQHLDLELQRAARTLPSKWWSVPKLDAGRGESQSLFWNTRRTFAQVVHYNLLIQLHLPYMLYSSKPERKHEYSRIICVNASREVLLRFNALRSFNGIGSSCRIVDFLAFMAAITLLLAHIDSHASVLDNALAHQYQSDRAMIEEAEEHMGAVDRLNSDTLSAHSIELLRQLLALDLELKDEDSPVVRRVSLYEAGTEAPSAGQDADIAVSIEIPYFGIVRVARQDARMEDQSQFTTAAANPPSQVQAVDGSIPGGAQIVSLSGLAGLGVDPNLRGTTLDHVAGDLNEAAENITELCTDTQLHPELLTTGVNDVASNFAPQPQIDVLDPLLRYGGHPGVACVNEDWASKDVDLAFFDSIMKGMGKEVSWGAEW